MDTDLFGDVISIAPRPKPLCVIQEYATKNDPDTGLKLTRYGGKWVPIIYAWSIDGRIAHVTTASDGLINCQFDKRGYLTLPNGRRTRDYYH